MKKKSIKQKNTEGFTLVELIIIIILVGIVAVYVVPKITTSGFQDSADTDNIISNIRYVQHRSMVTGGGWKISFDVSNNKYSVYDKNNNLANMPDTKNPVTIKSGITSVKDENGIDVVDIYFDYLGEPAKNIDGTILFDKKINVKISSYTIVIEPNAGGVYLQ